MLGSFLNPFNYQNYKNRKTNIFILENVSKFPCWKNVAETIYLKDPLLNLSQLVVKYCTERAFEEFRKIKKFSIKNNITLSDVYREVSY